MSIEIKEKKINLLNEEDIRIYRSEKHRICIEFVKEERVIHGVRLSLIFPLTDKRSFLRLFNDEGEIGIVRSIDRLDRESRAVVDKELKRIYFIPRITRVTNIEDKVGTRTWHVETDQGEHSFNVQGRQSVRFIAANRLIVKDIDGNRYEACLSDLDPSSRQILEVSI